MLLSPRACITVSDQAPWICLLAEALGLHRADGASAYAGAKRTSITPRGVRQLVRHAV